MLAHSSKRTPEELNDVYEHGILFETELRILELFPGNFDDNIRCELRNEPTHTDDGKKIKIHYEALSYTWGAPLPKKQIICSGKTLHITTNLFQALKHIRRKDRTRHLWVDAICINQFDIAERNQHVQRMDEVFAGADRVLIWLGEGSSEEGDGVLDVLPIWLSYYSPHIDWNAANIGWDTTFSTFNFSSKGLSRGAIEWLSYQQAHLMHLLHFFARRWWSRKWVIQEVVQAREARLTCGHEEISWAAISQYLDADLEKFSTWHDSLARIYNKHPNKAFINHANDGIFHARQLAHMAANFHGTDALSLWNVVYETNDFKCTEPRDNLFSLLAIAGDVRSGTPRDLLKVDYSSSIRKISINYCCWLLTYDPFALICFRTVAGSHGCSRDVPSWTPNIVPATWLQRPDLRRPLSMLSYDSGRLDKTPRPIWNLISEDRILSIKGVITETITEVIPPPYVDITNPGWLHFGRGHAVWLRNCYNTVASQTADPKKLIDLMYIILTCGGDKARSEDTRNWQFPSIETCQRWLDIIFDEHSGSEPNINADSELSAMTNSIVYVKWRQFCVTSEGRYGWVPEAARAGDKICVLPGGKVPLAISDCGNGHYNLMGETYINGIMYGEALDFGLPYQMIELC
jgi:hypothetical protein